MGRLATYLGGGFLLSTGDEGAVGMGALRGMAAAGRQSGRRRGGLGRSAGRTAATNKRSGGDELPWGDLIFFLGSGRTDAVAKYYRWNLGFTRSWLLCI